MKVFEKKDAAKIHSLIMCLFHLWVLIAQMLFNAIVLGQLLSLLIYFWFQQATYRSVQSVILYVVKHVDGVLTHSLSCTVNGPKVCGLLTKH